MIKETINKHRDCLILITRLIIGGIFIYSGWNKVTGIEQTLGYFSAMGIPAFLTYIVAYGELIGGILLVIGLHIEYTTIFLAIVMAVAVYLTRSRGMSGFGFPLATLAGILGIMANGAGKYAVKIPQKVS